MRTKEKRSDSVTATMADVVKEVIDEHKKDVANRLDDATFEAMLLIERNIVEFSTQAIEVERIAANLKQQLEARMQQLTRFQGAIEGAQHMITSTLQKNGVSFETYAQQKTEKLPAQPSA